MLPQATSFILGKGKDRADKLGRSGAVLAQLFTALGSEKSPWWRAHQGLKICSNGALTNAVHGVNSTRTTRGTFFNNIKKTKNMMRDCSTTTKREPALKSWHGMSDKPLWVARRSDFSTSPTEHDWSVRHRLVPAKVQTASWEFSLFQHDDDFYSQIKSLVYFHKKPSRGYSARIMVMNTVAFLFLNRQQSRNPFPFQLLCSLLPGWVRRVKIALVQPNTLCCRPLLAFDWKELSYGKTSEPVDVGVRNCHRHPDWNFGVIFCTSHRL